MTLFDTNNLYGNIDSFYVLLKDGYTIADFGKYRPWKFLYGDYEIEYIGNQNQAVVIVCKEMLLRSWSFQRIIHSYAPIPYFARIRPCIIQHILNSNAVRSDLHILAYFNKDANVTLNSFSALKKSSIAFSANDPLSNSLLDVSHS